MILLEILKSKEGIGGVVILCVFVAFSTVPQYIAPYNPAVSMTVAAPYALPSWYRLFNPSLSLNSAHGVLGSGPLGDDTFSELVYGARPIVTVGLLATVISLAVGLLTGLVSGYMAGMIDQTVMRAADVVLTIPVLPLLIIIVSVVKGGDVSAYIILIIASLFWPWTARVVRAEVLSIKERPFIEAMRVINAGHVRIMFKHILPNVISLIFATGTIAITFAISTVVGLDFMGLGNTAETSWGLMLYNAATYGAFTRGAWWFIVPPGLAIALTVLSFFLVSHALERALNPRIILI